MCDSNSPRLWRGPHQGFAWRARGHAHIIRTTSEGADVWTVEV